MSDLQPPPEPAASAVWYRRRGFWNLPNAITVFRIAMVPVVAFALWTRPTYHWAVASCVLFVIAMLSDVLDGWLARRWDLQSVAGAFLDPLADKLMVLTALVMMIPLGWVPAWIVVLMESRELAISGLRMVAMSEGMVIAAGSLGKFKTAYQSTAIGFLLWHYRTITIDAHSVGILLLYVSLLFSLASAAEYFWGFYQYGKRARPAA